MRNLDHFYSYFGEQQGRILRSVAVVIFLIVLFSPTVALSADNPKTVTVDLPKKNVTLSEFIDHLQKRTNFIFVYDSDLIDDSRPLTITVGKRSVEECLSDAFADGTVTYGLQNNFIILSPSGIGSKGAVGGEKIEGIVTDSRNEPVIGASVFIDGTTRGVTTDINGKFSLTLLPDSKVLTISYIGMKRKYVYLNPNKATYHFSLNSEYTDMEELVVIGYGSQSKKDVTGAITSISSDDIENNVGANINTVLQGKIPGMSVVSNSGEPGAGSTITIRGAASMNGSSEPLYIIDGVPMESGNITSIDGDATFSPLAGINPSDIETIDVLRDAASAAIYGSRAANGVVLITTKGGNTLKASKPVVSVSHTSSFVSVSRKIDALTSDQFRSAYIDARTNAGQTITNAWITNPTHPYYMNSTDWQDVIFRTAYQTKNDFSLRGSSENFAYSVSFGYSNVKPVIVGTDYQQYTGRVNFTYKITKMISAGTKISLSMLDYDRILSGNGTTGALRAALFTNPCFTPYDPITGELVPMLGQREGRNPLALALEFPINFKRQAITMNQYINFNILKGLDFKVSVSMDIDKTLQSSFTPRKFHGAATESARVDIGQFSQIDGRNTINENTLTYSRSFGDHSINAVLGQSMQLNRSESLYLNGENYIDENTVTIQNAAKMTRVERNTTERAMLSFFGRLNYGYKGRYLASFTLRRDGSSRFGSNKRFGNFPSASLGWRFSDESFMDFAKNWLYNAKLRASVGVTGNHSIGDYTWRGKYASDAAKYDGNVAITNTQLTNTRLGWETTTQYNLGLDLSLLNGRVSLYVDAYLKQSKDLLFNFPLPSYTGFGSVSTNFGSVENRGLEVLVNTVNIDGKFKWSSDFNISFNRNKITKLPQGRDIIIGTYSLAREGQPAGLFYGHNALGVYARTEDNVWKGADGTIRPVLKGSTSGEAFTGGDMIWSDLDGNGIIDDYDRMVIGNPHPKFIGGFGNTFSYKNFSLNVFLQFTYGNEVMNDLRRSRNRMTTTNNLGQDALSRWKSEGDITNFPKLSYGDKLENFRPSNFTIEDGSFLRLKDVSLSYRLPSSICNKLRMKSVNVRFAASNLLTWSNYSGYDPEVNSSTNSFVIGVDNGAFPKSRSYNIGIDITF